MVKKTGRFVDPIVVVSPRPGVYWTPNGHHRPAHFVTLGLLYEVNRRFAGGDFAPILKRVDRFLEGAFARTLPQREERAAKVRAASGGVRVRLSAGA